MFYSNEHEPIHIHGKFQGKESKAEIHLKNGRITRVAVKDKGTGLESNKKREFQYFVHCYAEDIVDKWVDYFVKKKHVSPMIITKKVKNIRVIGG
ncbi:DUF4160 domain-containing protein [Vibrio diabolicus]|uniref:DUF4160 domain-containing protein n=1 Tax=Vibrio diabolicus TaxID=50719 RepID=UPI001C70F65B